ncbi:MAG: lytic transglycosylase domain-containing protein [Mycobacteriales bacterium]
MSKRFQRITARAIRPPRLPTAPSWAGKFASPLLRWSVAGFLVCALLAWAGMAAFAAGARKPPARRVVVSIAASPAVSAPVISTQLLHRLAVIRSRPAAAAPIRTLPKVDTATITVRGIPPVVAAAYVSAARRLAVAEPACQLPWWLLAGIGLVESDQAISGGSLTKGWDGVARPPIYGPLLDGSGGLPAMANTATDAAIDGGGRWERAVGPMQFLPQTWISWASDGTNDGKPDPQDIWDAALSAGRYLCASAGGLNQPQNIVVAVYSYNHSFAYVRLVLTIAARYAGINPASLGINSLPSDPTAHHGAHRSSHKPKPAASKSPSPKASAQPASPSPSSAPVLPSKSSPPSSASPSASPITSPPSAPVPVPTLAVP